MLTFYGKTDENSLLTIFGIFGNTFSLKISVDLFLGLSSRKLASPSRVPTGEKRAFGAKGGGDMS